jgi:hypothetical protein
MDLSSSLFDDPPPTAETVLEPAVVPPQAPQRAQRVRARRAWLTSAVVHAILLIVLGLIAATQPEAIGALWVAFQSQGEPEPALQSFDLPSTSEPEQPEELEAVATGDVQGDLLAPTELVRSDAFDASLSSMQSSLAESVSGPLTRITAGRSGLRKEKLLAHFGGTQRTEKAVELGLRWLSKQQRPNGHWNFKGPYKDGSETIENRSGATGMALIAFAGAGHTHRQGIYKKKVRDGIAWLLKSQLPDGSFAGQKSTEHITYCHAIATIAICELYGMTNDSTLQEPAQKAIDFCVGAQSPKGGWRYTPQQWSSDPVDSDMSVTGWYVMALVSGRSAGLSIKPDTFDNITKYLDMMSSQGGSRFAYDENHQPTEAMTAEGVLCRMYLGANQNDPALRTAIDWMWSTKPLSAHDRNYYYWYYCTQVVHHYGGEPWARWNDVMRDRLVKMQDKGGDEQGSWDPEGSWFEDVGGRLYSTCLALYCLEVYYRHLPIYENPLQDETAQNVR